MNAWAAILALLAISLLLVTPAVGFFRWSPERAKAMKRAELLEDQIAVQVAYMQVRHPELVNCMRLDRHPSYVWQIAGLFAYGNVVLFLRFPYEQYAVETIDTRPAFGGSLLLGAFMMAVGTLLGKNFGKFTLGRRVAKNMVSPILGDDIRVPYVLGIFGMISTGISMAFYGYTAVESVGTYRFLTSLGGVSAIVIGAVYFTLLPQFVIRMRKYIHAREALIEEAKGRIAQEGS